MRALPLLLALSIGTAVSGCDFTKLASGQLELINGQRRIERALPAERDPERRAMLQELPRIRRFAEEVLELRPGKSYTGYFETEREGMTYVLSASERTRLHAYTWWFPVTGNVEYRSYFARADAEAAAANLEARGYDTWITPSRAYSTLGIFRDPVTTTMMRDGMPGFVEVLLHEMAHARLFVAGQTDWNEALASFVGDRGAQRYFEHERFIGTGMLESMHERAARKHTLDVLVARACDQLEHLYDAGLPPERVLRERQAVFDTLQRELTQARPDQPAASWRMNNARLVHFRRYSASSSDVVTLWNASGAHWRTFWRLAEQHARKLR